MDPSENLETRRWPLIALATAGALAAPFVARWLAVPSHGEAWLASYLSSRFFVLGWSLVHACTLFALGRSRAFRFTAFWVAAAASIAFATYAHFSVDLTTSSTALLAVIWIPVWAAVGALLVWAVLGFAMNRSSADE